MLAGCISSKDSENIQNDFKKTVTYCSATLEGPLFIRKSCLFFICSYCGRSSAYKRMEPIKKSKETPKKNGQNWTYLYSSMTTKFKFSIYLRKPSMTSLQRVNCVAIVAESPALELVLLLVLFVLWDTRVFSEFLLVSVDA